MTDVQIGEISAVEGNPFARGPRALIADDHPLVVAYRETLDTGEPLTVQTDTPDAVVKLLRKIAGQHELGVKVKADDSSVTFKAREKFTRAKKVSA